MVLIGRFDNLTGFELNFKKSVALDMRDFNKSFKINHFSFYPTLAYLWQSLEKIDILVGID